MPTSEQLNLLALCQIKGISWYLIAREAMRPQGLERLLEGNVSESSLEARETEVLLALNLDRLQDLLEEVQRRISNTLTVSGIKLTTVLDDDYPLNLRTIFNRPPFLFYRGDLQEQDIFSVAVVGTRQASDDGLRRAAKIARRLAEKEVTVLSGLARGIDTAAHEATLDAQGGRTIAVLGSGILHMYPPENEELASQIAERGAVVSQFWPDSPPARYTFPWRNITMSGLGQGTVVVEASATSGAKMQARLALQHGKKVFLLESLVQNNSWAQVYLERGAIQVKSVEDIVDQLRSPESMRETARQVTQLSFGLR